MVSSAFDPKTSSNASANVLPAALLNVLVRTNKNAQVARRNRKGISGSNFYGQRHRDLHAEATNELRTLKTHLAGSSTEIYDALSEIDLAIREFFETSLKFGERARILSRAKFLVATQIAPAFEERIPSPITDALFPLSILAGSRSYIKAVAAQACGSYDQGWYDASSVMSRRLLETLVIECFESHLLSEKIKRPDGSFLFFGELISKFLAEPAWNVGRNAKAALPRLKNLGDQSAHNRRFIAHKSDVDKLRNDLRIVVEELVHLTKA